MGSSLSLEEKNRPPHLATLPDQAERDTDWLRLLTQNWRMMANHQGRLATLETLLPGCRNALERSEYSKMREIALFGPHPGDPLTMSHFGPPHSIRRRVGRPCLEGAPGPRIFRASPAQRGRKAIYQGCLASSPGAGRAVVQQGPVYPSCPASSPGAVRPVAEQRPFTPRVWPPPRGQ